MVGAVIDRPPMERATLSRKVFTTGKGGRAMLAPTMRSLEAVSYTHLVGDDKPHIGSRPAVQHGVFARAGDYHVASQPQQRLKRHNKRQIGAALDFPVGEQRLVVDEPAAVFYFVGLGLHHRSDGDFLTLPHSKRLVVPEPERLHAQKAAADFKQTVDKAEVLSLIHI